MINAVNFPFNYTPENPHYKPLQITSKYCSGARLPAYYYYQFINDNLKNLEDIYYFLKTVLTSDAIAVQEKDTGDIPLMFKKIQVPGVAGGFHEVIENGQTYQRGKLPHDMHINYDALFKDLTGQFPKVSAYIPVGETETLYDIALASPYAIFARHFDSSILDALSFDLSSAETPSNSM